METTATYQIVLDTPIHMLTPRQLFEMMGEWQAKQPKTEDVRQERKHWYVNKVEDLAKILGTSASTIYRIKGEGVLDDCISQCGKWMMIDVERVIEKFRLSNRRKRKVKG